MNLQTLAKNKEHKNIHCKFPWCFPAQLPFFFPSFAPFSCKCSRWAKSLRRARGILGLPRYGGGENGASHVKHVEMTTQRWPTQMADGCHSSGSKGHTQALGCCLINADLRAATVHGESMCNRNISMCMYQCLHCSSLELMHQKLHKRCRRG